MSLSDITAELCPPAYLKRDGKTKRMICFLLSLFILSGCGGGGGGNNSANTAEPDTASPDPNPALTENEDVSESTYFPLEVHLGYENGVSNSRINFPLYIPANDENWRFLGEEFRQLGLLVDQWDKSVKGENLLADILNIPLLGADVSVFTRNIRIIQTSWDEIGEKCGYGSSGSPNNGCSYNKNLPDCSIYVPEQAIYQDGDVNAYHALLGHEMWHCLVGSFHS